MGHPSDDEIWQQLLIALDKFGDNLPPGLSEAQELMLREMAEQHDVHDLLLQKLDRTAEVCQRGILLLDQLIQLIQEAEARRDVDRRLQPYHDHAVAAEAATDIADCCGVAGDCAAEEDE